MTKMIKCDHEEPINDSLQTETEQQPAIQIPLGQGAAVLLSNEDADLTQYPWYPAVRNERLAYAACWTHKDENGKWVRQFLHRMVMERVEGRKLDSREHVDHIDNNGLNNTRENLRIVNTSQNGANRRLSTRNKSGYKGVSWNTQTRKWCACIIFHRKKFHLGSFDNKHDAARAYNEKALELQGLYAKINAIDESGNNEALRAHTQFDPPKKKAPRTKINKIRKIRKSDDAATQQTHNRLHSRNTSGYRGVSWFPRTRKWCVSIRLHGKNVTLGYFYSKHDAARAYNEKALEIHGQYAKINVIDESGDTMSPSTDRCLTSRNTSGYNGVSWAKHAKKWYADIGFQGKIIHLGSFTNKHDAARAYNAKAIELHGERARLNVIDESSDNANTEGL